MECNAMSTDIRRASGYTFVEMMVASAIAVMVATMVASLIFFSTRSYVTMGNYTEMGQRSQMALDKMSKEIRQAREVTAFTTNSITFLNSDGTSFTFAYDPGKRTLSRATKTKKTVYLSDCDSLRFNVY